MSEPGNCIAAVILAAGESRRFGPENKLIAEVGGVPLVRRVAETVARGGISEIVVVTGHGREAVEAALGDLPVRIAYNSSWSRGMGSSIAVGIGALGEDAIGAFIVPGDMALISTALVERLVRSFEAEGAAKIIVPVTTRGEQRNPVLWPRKYFSDLARLEGAEGAKKLIAKHSAFCTQVTIEDESVFGDVDTRDELAAARARLGDQR